MPKSKQPQTKATKSKPQGSRSRFEENDQVRGGDTVSNKRAPETEVDEVANDPEMDIELGKRHEDHEALGYIKDDGDRDDGENTFEGLEQTAAENGPGDEEEVNPSKDEDDIEHADDRTAKARQPREPK